MITVRISWTNAACEINTTATNLYLFYSAQSRPGEVDNGNSWQIVGIDKSIPWLMVTDLTPAVKYKSYLLQSTEDGNGPPSSVFIMETPIGRKLILANVFLIYGLVLSINMVMVTWFVFQG